MAHTEFRKQISIFMPISDWLLLRDEAARLNVSVTELCRKQLKPLIKKIAKRRDG